VHDVETSNTGRICLVCNTLTASERCPKDGSATLPANTRPLARPGDLIDGRYLVSERLGGGGFGEVYRAVHQGTHEQVAIKILRAESMTEERGADRFANEARTCAALKHPNTVRVFDFGQTPAGDPYLAMELLEGAPLDCVLLRAGRLDTRRTARIAVQVLKSLAEAHGRGVIHRDLKPDNIFICDIHGEKDFVKVIDFGLAKLTHEPANARLTQTGVVMGTPYYLSPEQIKAQPIDARTDLYAFSVVLYQCLTGVLPFTGQSVVDVLIAHVQAAPRPPRALFPDIDPAFAALVLRGLAKEPARRFESADAMRAAIEAILARPDIVSGPVTTLPADAPSSSPAPARPTPVRIDETLPLEPVAPKKTGRGESGRHRRPKHGAPPHGRHPIEAPSPVPVAAPVPAPALQPAIQPANLPSPQPRRDRSSSGFEPRPTDHVEPASREFSPTATTERSDPGRAPAFDPHALTIAAPSPEAPAAFPRVRAHTPMDLADPNTVRDGTALPDPGRRTAPWLAIATAVIVAAAAAAAWLFFDGR